nr:hypothetical protein [uncultured Undibacterium sp.]
MSDTPSYLVVPASKDDFAGIKTLYLQVARQGGGIALWIPH